MKHSMKYTILMKIKYYSLLVKVLNMEFTSYLLQVQVT